MQIKYSGDRFESPFPHYVVDGFLPLDVVAKINNEWPESSSQSWKKESGKANKKWGSRALTPTAKQVLDAIDIDELEDLTGIPDLISDPDLFGAGLHCIPRGGYLNMHVDFNQHPNGWERRVNVLIYLNLHWNDDWNGHLLLGKDRSKSIAPTAGRCVIFESNDKSWHGHPLPLQCPEHVQRRSLAFYLYTENKPKKPAHSTIYAKK